MELKVENKLTKEEAQKLTNNVSNITNEKIEKSLNYDELSKAEKKAVDEFNKKNRCHGQYSSITIWSKCSK